MSWFPYFRAQQTLKCVGNRVLQGQVELGKLLFSALDLVHSLGTFGQNSHVDFFHEHIIVQQWNKETHHPYICNIHRTHTSHAIPSARQSTQKDLFKSSRNYEKVPLI